MSGIQRSDWNHVRFGDVVHLNTERVADPVAAGIERYVGLEHIEPEDLRIRTWGLVEGGTTFTNYFKPGQVLFGKRRAYQRKVAMADFEGVCSSDIYVFETKDPGILLPELLPFICQTESFFEFAVETSAGSLSPRTNWSHLANYEFALPPLEEQRRFAKVIRSFETLRQGVQASALSILGLQTSIVESFIEHCKERISLEKVLLDVTYGSSTRANNDERGVPILRIPNVLRNEIDLDDLMWVNLPPNEIQRYSVSDGDILIVRTNGNPDYVGRCVVAEKPTPHTVFASYLIRLRVNKNLTYPDYIARILNSPSLRRGLRGSVRSSAGNYNLNAIGIKRQLIPLPSLFAQSTLLERLNEIKKAAEAINKRAIAVEALKVQILGRLEGKYNTKVI